MRIDIDHFLALTVMLGTASACATTSSPPPQQQPEPATAVPAGNPEPASQTPAPKGDNANRPDEASAEETAGPAVEVPNWD